MPINVGQLELKSMSKADLKAHRTALNALIAEMNNTFVTGPMMETYQTAKDNIVSAKETLDDVVAMKDTVSFKAVAGLREYNVSLKQAKFYTQMVTAKTPQNAIFRKSLDSVIENIDGVMSSVENVTKERMKPYTDKAKKITNKRYGLLRMRSPSSPENLLTFTGGQPFNTDSPSKYNMGRSAVTSATVGYLLCQGFNAEDILDHTKLADEKRKAFREIAERMNRGSDEDELWLGKVFVEGVDKIIGIVNTVGKEITPEEANLSNKKFVDLITLAHTWHDITQEMDKCKDKGYRKYVRDVRHEDPDEYSERANKKGILAQMSQIYLDAAQTAEKIMDPSVTINREPENYLKSIITCNHMLYDFLQMRHDNPNKPVSRLGSSDEYLAKLPYYEQKLSENYINNKYQFDDLTPDQRFGIMDHLINSDVLKKTDYEVGSFINKGIAVAGLPSRDEIFAAGAAYGVTRRGMMRSLCESIENAKIDVSFGSSEYNEAEKAVKALSNQLNDYQKKRDSNEITTNKQKKPEYEKMREQARIAEEKINKYLEHKRDQGLLDGGASPKTQKRINVMRKALAEIKKSRKMFEAKIVDMYQDRAQTVMQQKFIAERAIDDIALNAKNKALTAEEKTRLNNGIAAASVCDDEIFRLRKDHNAQPKTVQELATRAEKRINSKPFKDTIKQYNRNSAKTFMANREYFRNDFDININVHKQQAAKNAHKKARTL